MEFSISPVSKKGKKANVSMADILNAVASGNVDPVNDTVIIGQETYKTSSISQDAKGTAKKAQETEK